jgi:hypothetical protein
MSWNHESVAWQSKDKTWSIGFYPCTPHGSEDDGYDPEWDVEYDYNSFDFVSTGHTTSDEAERAGSKNYGNSGGSQILRWHKENAAAIANCEEMALWHTNPEQAKLNLKKKNAKLTREHMQQLKELFAENNDYKGRRVTVTLKLDDAPYTLMGASRHFTGYATTEGDWLVVEKQKVKNLKSGRLNRKLHSIKSAPADTWGRGYGRGYY